MARQDDYMKTALRLPRELHEQLTAAAAAGSVSLNAEMIRRLQASFEAAPSADRIKELESINLQLAKAIDAFGRRIDTLEGTILSLLRKLGTFDRLFAEDGINQPTSMAVEDQSPPVTKRIRRTPPKIR